MSAYEQAKQSAKKAAASLLNVARDKAAAAVKSTTEVIAEAPAKAKAEGWNKTPGPRA